MKIEQITITKIIADEGKILKRKGDGHFYGAEVTLGYNYYEAGVALSKPKLETPDDYEEVDMPEGLEERPIIDHVKRLKRTKELMQQNIKEINSLKLSVADALEVIEFFPEWLVDEGFLVGDTVTNGTKFKYQGKLYAVLQDHQILPYYKPSIDTASLYVEVTPDYNEQGEELGTLENPIPYGSNMVLEKGKYYSQDDVTYLCWRDSINPLYNALNDLVGHYVEEV